MAVDVKNAQSERRGCELDFLKIIPPDFKLFDNLSVSSGQESELSGQFSEYEKGEGFSEKRKSYELMKTDLYSYFSFSEEFKAAMESVKSEMKTSLIEVNSEEAEEPQIPEKESEIQKELQRETTELLRETKFVLRDKNDVNADSPKIVRKQKEKLKVYEDDEYFDTMSGYWRMMAAYDEFNISHPDYNAYENEKPHWLETKQIPLEITDNSREKCLQWLKENFENY